MRDVQPGVRHRRDDDRGPLEVRVVGQDGLHHGCQVSVDGRDVGGVLLAARELGRRCGAGSTYVADRAGVHDDQPGGLERRGDVEAQRVGARDGPGPGRERDDVAGDGAVRGREGDHRARPDRGGREPGGLAASPRLPMAAP